MTEEITLKCKICGEPFSYSETAYQLMAEKGEDRFFRCQQCRQPHSREIKEVKVPYSPLQERMVPGLNFRFLEHTSHGERVLKKEEKQKEDWDLSITDKEILTLYQMLEENQVVVVVSPTGTGKSTYIPKRLIEQPESYAGDFVDKLIRQGQIIITQPRILATIRVPESIAKISGSSVGPGHLIGYRYSEADLSDRWNQAVTITDGTLPNWIKEGKLGQYSLIFVDEAHERSCNIDGILGFFRKELPKYPQLRLIISSATINAQKFVDAFQKMNVLTELFDLSFLAEKKRHKGYIHFWKDENAYVLSPEGVLEKTTDCKCWFCRKSPKEKREFRENQKDEISESELPEIIANLISRILTETKEGDIVVFLHSEKTIKQTVQKIEARHKKVKVIPAYRKIQEETEEELAKETTKRRVIVGTNLLETSITLKGAVYGIDSGFIKEAKWDPATQISTLPTERHSQDGRKQRWGRLGRTEDGYVYNLYTKEEFEKAEKHTLPEITRSSLEDSLVNLKGAGITEVDQFPWMEKPSEHPQMKKEIQRARQSLKEKGVINQREEITERALELLGIPRQSAEAFFLVSADDQGLLFEAITALFLMSTREQEARTGANLYNSGLGLLLWKSEWDAKTKAKVWAIHRGLQVGCKDDLDFVIKLAYCFHKAEEKGIAQEWAKRHFVNYDNLQKIFSDIGKLITERFGEEREESVREIDIAQMDKIRALMATSWPDKVVNLRQGKPITYSVADKTKIGVISPRCVGSWQREKQAIVTTAIEEEAVVDGYPKRVPTASFMVQLPSQASTDNQTDLFIDQRFPVGGWVQIKKEGQKFYLGELEKLPLPIKVSYRKILDFSEEDYLEEGLTSEKEIPFDKDFLTEREFTVPLQGSWISEKTAEKARIVEWKERNGIPVAILSPFKETKLRSLDKKIGDTLKIKIHQVARDPIGRGGWAIGKTKEGFEIPIELSEMSLSPWGPGLERIEGQILNLIINNFEEDGLPQLSNIDRIIEDLRGLREKIIKSKRATKVSKRKFIELPGFVAEINEEEEKAIVVVPREKGILHPFEAAQIYIPGGKLQNLRIEEELTVHLLKRTDRDEIPIDLLTDKEIENKPKGWKLQKEEGKISVPLCLEDKDFENWPARSEAIDFVKRHSWQFCLNIRVISFKERLAEIKPRDLIAGVITEINYEDDEQTIKSAQVVLENDIPGFVFGNDLSTTSAGAKTLFYVKKIDLKSGYLRLVEKVKWEEQIEQIKQNIRKAKDAIVKIRQNIAKNQNTLAKIRQNIAKNRDSLERIRKRIDENRNKRDTATSKKWKEIFNEWVEQGEEQENRVISWIEDGKKQEAERIKWIEEDKRKIRDIELSIKNWEEKLESQEIN